MKVVIGSSNRAKVRGVKKAFMLLGVREFITLPIHGFKDQPIGFDEIFLNAVKRTVEAYRSLEGEEGFAVGIEAGIIEYGGLITTGQLAIVTDGEKYSIGLSGFFPLPQKFKNDIKKGVELGVLMKELSGIEDIASSIGAVGFFTKGLVTRSDLSYYATLYALIPWINPDIEFDLPPYSVLEEMLKRADFV